ncbi:MAG: hypothetical protein ACLFR6_04060 [Salinarchaeum sp.]
MTDPRQQVSQTGIRILFAFVVVYVAVGAALYFRADLPAFAYAGYGILGWVGGMYLFYRLHRSFMADLEADLE